MKCLTSHTGSVSWSTSNPNAGKQPKSNSLLSEYSLAVVSKKGMSQKQQPALLRRFK